jgi:hypothetical protein
VIVSSTSVSHTFFGVLSFFISFPYNNKICGQ